MTLYRLAKESKVIKALICAAKNGKKVTVVIELLARFDEASNINWSKRMQDAGIHVIFGVEGLKIHSKLVHIGTRHGDIACVSTGNFHEGNARMYTDYTIMTAHRPIVREVNAVFDFIEKPYTPVNFKELLVSPNDMRKRLIALINKEIKNKEQGKVLVQIVIGKDGNVSNIKILKGASAWLDAEAIRVGRGMPKWEPGKQNGQAVAVEYTFPITFRLQ